MRWKGVRMGRREGRVDGEVAVADDLRIDGCIACSISDGAIISAACLVNIAAGAGVLVHLVSE